MNSFALSPAPAGHGRRGISDPGALGCMKAVGTRAFLAATLMMVLFFHAARVAHGDIRPVPLVAALSVRRYCARRRVSWWWITTTTRSRRFFFYTNRTAWLLNGRFNNLVYGSYAPGAPEMCF